MAPWVSAGSGSVLSGSLASAAERVEAARKIIAALNPDARVIEVDRGAVALGAVMGTGLFDFDRAAEHLAHTLAALGRVERLAATLVVLAPDDDQFEGAVPGFAGERGWVARCGGASRAERPNRRRRDNHR